MKEGFELVGPVWVGPGYSLADNLFNVSRVGKELYAR